MPQGPLRPPAGQALTLDNGQLSPAWAAFFQDLADALGGLSRTPSYANDAAAHAGGVAIGQTYRNNSTVCVRVV